MNADQLLSDLGDTFGMPGLRFNARGSVSMHADNGRTLGFEKQDAGLVVFLAEPVQHGLPERLLKAFKRAHATTGDLPVQVAVRDQEGVPNLLMLVRLNENDMSLSNAQRSLRLLTSWAEAR